MKNIITAGLAMAALSAWSAPATSHDKHAHETWSAGEPGNRQKPSRTIEVEMSEMAYTPSRIEVKRGEQIRFVIRNAGEEDHEFLLATTEENLKHAEEMKKHPHMEHDDPNGVRLAPSEIGRDRLEIHQGRHVRIFLPDPRPSRVRHDRPNPGEMK